MSAALRRFLIPAFLVALSVPGLAPDAEAALGDLDPSFDTDGKVTTPIGPDDDFAKAVAVQPDGKIVAVGYTFFGSNYDFAAARYTSSGALDPTFGIGGKVITPISPGFDRATAVALQPDGKVVVVGSTHPGSTDDFAAVRYTSGGALDSTFGSGGVVTTSIGSGNDDATAVVLQSDGAMVVAGSTFGPISDFAVVRYTSTGALDATFGLGGIVTTSIGSGNDGATGVVLQPDGKIVAAGTSIVGSFDDFALVRYTSSGALDATFGSGGKVTTPIGAGTDQAWAVRLQPDGRIVAAGGTFGSTYDFALARYTRSGALDTTFGSGGKVTTPISAGDEVANAMALQPDGQIVAAGFTVNPSPEFAVVRYTSTGSLDPTFGSGGEVITPVSPADNVASAVAIQDDGRIVAAGYATFGSDSDFGLARYLGIPSVSVNDVSVVESDSGTVGASFTLTLSDAYDLPITVDFYTDDGTAKAGSDYRARWGTRGFLPGQISKKVTILVNGDTAQEGNESFLLRLIDADGASMGDDAGVATIVDNDLPSITINDVTATELNGTNTKAYAFKITLSKAGTNTITVTYTTVDGTAVAPGDYTAKSGTLTYAPGTLSKTVNVTVKGDNIVEPNETFILHISSATFATVADADGLGTIVNND